MKLSVILMIWTQFSIWYSFNAQIVKLLCFALLSILEAHYNPIPVSISPAFDVLSCLHLSHLKSIFMVLTAFELDFNGTGFKNDAFVAFVAFQLFHKNGRSFVKDFPSKLQVSTKSIS